MNRKFLLLILSVLLLTGVVYFKDPFARSLYFLGEKTVLPLLEPSEKVASLFSLVWRLEKVRERNNELRNENEQLRAELSFLSGLEEENEEMRRALGAGLREDFDLLAAKVIFRNLKDDFFIINKGKEDNIEEGFVVVDAARSLVGWVDKVYQGFSRVTLLTAEGKRVPVEFEDDGVRGEMVSGKNELLVTLVPREKELKREEVLITSGLEKSTPYGVRVGTISSVKKKDINPFQEGAVAPFADLNRVLTVFLIMDY